MNKLSFMCGALLIFLGGFSSSSFGYYIAGTVYCDSSDDGIITADDILLSNVTVVTSSPIYGVYTEVTDANGAYVENLAPQGAFSDIYEVHLDASTLDALAFVIVPASGSHEVDLVNFLWAEGVDFLVDAPGCGATPPACGDNVIDDGEQCDDGNLIDGDGCSASCTIELAGEGCTPGYWKQEQHFASWNPAYSPDTLFSSIFENAFPGKTLLEVLSSGGGGLYALGRHTVAALLNSESGNVNYDMQVTGVISGFNSVFPGSKPQYNATKNVLQDLNEIACPLN